MTTCRSCAAVVRRAPKRFATRSHASRMSSRPMTGSSSTTPCDPASTGKPPCGCSVELADDPVGGLLAIPVSDTLKRVSDDARVAAHGTTQRALARADAADVPLCRPPRELSRVPVSKVGRTRPTPWSRLDLRHVACREAPPTSRSRSRTICRLPQRSSPPGPRAIDPSSHARRHHAAGIDTALNSGPGKRLRIDSTMPALVETALGAGWRRGRRDR